MVWQNQALASVAPLVKRFTPTVFNIIQNSSNVKVDYKKKISNKTTSYPVNKSFIYIMKDFFQAVSMCNVATAVSYDRNKVL